jgi:DNA-binding NtrC family response regulator
MRKTLEVALDRRADRAAARISDGPLPLAGSSDAAQRGRQALASADSRRTPVLITAEPGCRALAIAEWLHARARRGTKLVTIDCGAGDPVEIDRRLFGASPRRTTQHDLESIGGDAAFVAAGAGTLYLENIDELPASSQRRLARVLRDGEARVASRAQAVALGCRLVASTFRDLDSEVRDGRFPEDLRRRLAPTRITVPALRQRPADLAVIVQRLLREMDSADRAFTQPAITVLAALPWPQNIDELADVLAKVMATAGPVIRQEDVLMHVPIEGSFAHVDLTTPLRDARRRFERDYIAAVLERHQWRMSDAAAALGIERANLYRKTRQLGIVRIPRAEVS